MALICTTTTTWVTKEVLDPVKKWVSERKKKCKAKKKWWQKLFCWFVTILVEVIEWVVRYITVPILNTICVVVTGVIGGLLLPFAAAIDATNDKTKALDWVKKWWITPTKITFKSKSSSASRPGYYDYVFICRCKGKKEEIIVTAKDDVEAQKLAIAKCKEKCK